MRIVSPAALALACIGLRAFADDQGTAARAAQRYADCLNAAEVECLLDLTYPTPTSLLIWRPDRPPPLPTQSVLFAAGKQARRDTYTYWLVDVDTPVPITAANELRYVLVPYRLHGFAGFWYERTGYFVGVSGNGENWCFIEDAVVEDRGLERIAPAYAGPPLPAISRTQSLVPGLTRSDYLETARGAFSVPGGGGEAYYELEFDVGKRIRNEIALIIRYDNPEDPERPYVVLSSLARGQDELRISSPRVSGFETGAIYDVVVTGRDPETEDVLFEHRQSMAFRPVAGHGSEILPAIATIERASFESREGIFPRDWIAGFEVSVDELCAGSVAP